MKITVETEISARRIADLFITLIESGDPVTTASRGGWCAGINLVGPVRGEDYVSKGQPHDLWYADPAVFENPATKIEVIELDNETTGHTKKHTLNLNKIKHGFEFFARERPKDFAAFMTEGDDAATADIWLQLTVLGDIVYG